MENDLTSGNFVGMSTSSFHELPNGALSSFHISIPQEKLDWICSRVDSFPWTQLCEPHDPTSWTHGPSSSALRDICAHWTSSYSWRATESRINSFPHYTCRIHDLTVHFVSVRGSNPANHPLLLIHGWPYSFYSYLHLVRRLAHPEDFGGSPEDGCDVVVPSLPGFGFSEKPTRPVTPKEMADMMNELMTNILGYGKYVAHGGDWGSYISELLGFQYPQHCQGIHITMSSVRHHGAAPRGGQYTVDARPAEIAFAKKEKSIWDVEKGYMLLQSTRPSKLAFAMADSPVGVLAYLLEAWHRWADLRDRSFFEVFEPDLILNEVMVYLVTETFQSAMGLYVADYEHGTWTLPEGKRIEAPVGVLACPDPVFPMPPREVLERSRAIVLWRNSESGGHFPFYEVTEIVIEELIRFRTLLKDRGVTLIH